MAKKAKTLIKMSVAVGDTTEEYAVVRPAGIEGGTKVDTEEEYDLPCGDPHKSTEYAITKYLEGLHKDFVSSSLAVMPAELNPDDINPFLRMAATTYPRPLPVKAKYPLTLNISILGLLFSAFEAAIWFQHTCEADAEEYASLDAEKKRLMSPYLMLYMDLAATEPGDSGLDDDALKSFGSIVLDTSRTTLGSGRWTQSKLLCLYISWAWQHVWKSVMAMGDGGVAWLDIHATARRSGMGVVPVRSKSLVDSELVEEVVEAIHKGATEAAAEMAEAKGETTTMDKEAARIIKGFNTGEYNLDEAVIDTRLSGYRTSATGDDIAFASVRPVKVSGISTGARGASSALRHVGLFFTLELIGGEGEPPVKILTSGGIRDLRVDEPTGAVHFRLSEVDSVGVISFAIEEGDVYEEMDEVMSPYSEGGSKPVSLTEDTDGQPYALRKLPGAMLFIFEEAVRLANRIAEGEGYTYEASARNKDACATLLACGMEPREAFQLCFVNTVLPKTEEANTAMETLVAKLPWADIKGKLIGGESPGYRDLSEAGLFSPEEWWTESDEELSVLGFVTRQSDPLIKPWNRVRNILFEGPTSAGKSALCERIADATGREYAQITLSGDSETGKFLAENVPTWTKDKDGKGHMEFPERLTRFADVYGRGGVIELAEANLAHPSIITFLNTALDKSLDLGYRVIERHPETLVICTANVEYAGTRPWNEAFRNRLTVCYHFDELTVEAAAVRQRGRSGDLFVEASR